jgi:hypothetical protein
MAPLERREATYDRKEVTSMVNRLVAVLAMVIGLSFGAATFVQADEKAAPAPAAGGAAPAEKKEAAEKKDMAGDKKAEKADKKKDKAAKK